MFTSNIRMWKNVIVISLTLAVMVDGNRWLVLVRVFLDSTDPLTHCRL